MAGGRNAPDGQRPKGWNKGDMVTIEFIEKVWAMCYRIPKLRPKMNQINTKVQTKLAVITYGIIYIIVPWKPHFVVNTIGALLEVANDPLINAFLNIRLKLNVALMFPPIQWKLRAFRDYAYPFVEKIINVTGAIDSIKNAEEVKENKKKEKKKAKESSVSLNADGSKPKLGMAAFTDVNLKQGLQDTYKNAEKKATEPYNTMKGRVGMTRDMRNYYKNNADKINEMNAARRNPFMKDRAKQLEKELQSGAMKTRKGAFQNFSDSDKLSFRDARTDSGRSGSKYDRYAGDKNRGGQSGDQEYGNEGIDSGIVDELNSFNVDDAFNQFDDEFDGNEFSDHMINNMFDEDDANPVI
ncbi:MAG: hypothetical protein FWE01_02365 [Firmicutes bacterium]|nr:hypothetical protein [Bacillota bacterium]